MPRQRFSTAEAANILGLSRDAIRKRAARKQIEYDRDSSGRLFVWLDIEDAPGPGHKTSPGISPGTSPGQDSTQDASRNRDLLIERMESEIEFLRSELGKEREANRENRRLLAVALEQRRELEPPPANSPPETRESPVNDKGAPYGTSPQEAEESLHKRSWWQRLFGA